MSRRPRNSPGRGEQTQRSRQIALIVALSTGSVFIALMIFGLFVRSWSNKLTDGELVDPSQHTISPDPAETPADIDPTTESSQPATDVSDQTEVTDDSQVEPDRVIVDSDTEATTRDSAEPPKDLISPSPIIAPAVAMTEDGESTAEDPAPGMSELPPGLAEFTNLIDLANDADLLEPTLEAPPSMDDLEIEGPAEESIDPMMIATPPPPINMKRGLALKMALAIDPAEGYPLADLTLLISQVTAIPIQLDWLSMDIANIDVRRAIKIGKQKKSVRELLDEIVAKVGARVELRESMILITPSTAAFDARSGSILQLDDFGEGRSSAAQVVNRFLSAVTKDAADERIAAGTTRAEQQLAILAVESLRQMRRLPTKIDNATLSRWTQAAEAQPENWNPLTGGKSGPQYDAPVAIAEVLRRVARDNQASCIVNWHDARRRRLSPEQLVLPFAGNDGGTQLADMLAPFEMQVRRVDDHHWWVGTAATYDRLPLVLWTQPLGERRDGLTRQIENMIATTDQGTFRMTIDPVSDRALLLLPRFIAGQLPEIRENLVAK